MEDSASKADSLYTRSVDISLERLPLWKLDEVAEILLLWGLFCWFGLVYLRSLGIMLRTSFEVLLLLLRLHGDR